MERVFVRTERGSVVWSDGPAELSLRERTPSPRLRAYVESLQLCRETLPAEVRETVWPDGAVHLFFDLGDRPSCTVAGASAGPLELSLSGRIEQVGVRLRAGAIARVLGAPAHLITETTPLAALWGIDAQELLERLAALPAPARFDAVERALERRLSRVEDPPDRRVAAAVSRIASRGGAVRVRALAAELGLTERRLEQLFAEQVGLSPRVFARITRFRRAAALLAGGARGAEVAAACGYTDQAHLGREFRALAGKSPGAVGDFGFVQARPGAAP